MRTLLILLAALVAAPLVSAESGVTGISITLDDSGKPKVTIVSTWKEANVRNATVAEAAKRIAAVRGANKKNAVLMGSIDFVGIVAPEVPLTHYLPILEAVARNSFLQLYFVDGTRNNGVSNNIRRMIEQDAAQNPGDG